MKQGRRRYLLGLLTLAALVAIVVGVTGVEFPVPHFGATHNNEQPLPGVRAIASSTILSVGSTAPPGGELAFLAVEPSGNLIVSDARRRSVMRFDPSGHLLSEWGPDLGSAQLEVPAGVAVQGHDYYVIDRGTPRIFRLDGSGRVQATVSLDQFSPYGLNGLTIDRAGSLYVADTGRNRILVLSQSGALLKTIGRPGADLGALTQPMMAAFAADGTLFVADWENSRIASWQATGAALDAWSVGTHPFGVAVDRLGRVLVPDADRHTVTAYTPHGAVLGTLGLQGSPAITVVPRQVAVGADNRSSLFVLGPDGVQRLDLADTAPPPQATSDVDYPSLLVIALLVTIVLVAVVSRRGRRRRTALLRATANGPVRLDAKDSAQGQDQETSPDQQLLIAHQAERQQ